MADWSISHRLTTIASLPSKEELISKLLFVINAQAQRIVTVINAVPRDLAVVIKQIGDKAPAGAALRLKQKPKKPLRHLPPRPHLPKLRQLKHRLRLPRPRYRKKLQRRKFRPRPTPFPLPKLRLARSQEEAASQDVPGAAVGELAEPVTDEKGK